MSISKNNTSQSASIVMSRANCLMVVFLIAPLLFTEKTQAQPITIAGGNPVLTITTGIPGGQPIPIVNTATTIQYRRQNLLSKITVGTSCPGQRFNLTVVATGVTVGVAAPVVTLTNGMLAVDFINSIPAKPPANSVTAILQYTASATFAQGNSAEVGNDVHTITYTIQVQ